jgi:hypothetical protein
MMPPTAAAQRADVISVSASLTSVLADTVGHADTATLNSPRPTALRSATARRAL